MSIKNHTPEQALGIWQLQTDILMTHGVNLATRSFVINGDIEAKLFEIVDAKLALIERESNEPITIKLNSTGGDPYSAWAIVSRIKSSPCHIIIEAHGCVASAATMILAAGDHKRVSKYCTVMFHESSIDDFSGKFSDMKDVAHALNQEEKMYTEFLAKASKKSSKFWANMIQSKRDVYLTARELLRMGIIDEVF